MSRLARCLLRQPIARGDVEQRYERARARIPLIRHGRKRQREYRRDDSAPGGSVRKEARSQAPGIHAVADCRKGKRAQWRWRPEARYHQHRKLA